MHNLPKHKTTLSWLFVMFQWKLHFIHDFSSNNALIKIETVYIDVVSIFFNFQLKRSDCLFLITQLMWKHRIM